MRLKSQLNILEKASTFASNLTSRCMNGARRPPTDVNVLGFDDISPPHVCSNARRTIVIKVPREDDEWQE